MAGSAWTKAVLGSEVYLDPPPTLQGRLGGKMGNLKDKGAAGGSELGLMLLQPFAPLPCLDLSPASSTPSYYR